MAMQEHVASEYKGRAIEAIIEHVDGSDQFEFLPKEFPKDEENYLRSAFRSINGEKLTVEIIHRDCILVGNDKAGMSIVLNIPVPVDASLNVHMKTWVHPCHSDYGVTKTSAFGVGMVPTGDAKEQEWTYGKLDTCIDDGFQFNGDLPDFRSMMFSGGGAGGMAAALLAGGDPVQYELEVRENGVTKESKKGHQAKLTLSPIELNLVRDAQGNSELRFQQGYRSLTVAKKATIRDECDKKRANSEDTMQLFFNCLGWADNNTYVQFDSVSLKTKEHETEDIEENNIQKQPASKKLKEAKPAQTDDLPDYNKILRDDPILRQQIDALIQVKKNQDDCGAMAGEKNNS